jgi:hypothetical protein
VELNHAFPAVLSLRFMWDSLDGHRQHAPVAVLAQAFVRENTVHIRIVIF